MVYRHRRANNAAIRTRLTELAADRRRFGWRRRKLLSEREGIRVNHMARNVAAVAASEPGHAGINDAAAGPN
jgi:hypothetical protein